MAASKVFVVAVAIMLLGFYLAAKAETGTVGDESGETKEMKSLLSLRLSTLLPQITSKKLFQNGCDGNPCDPIIRSCYYLLNGCTCNLDTNECFKEAVPPPAEYDDTFDDHEDPDIVDDQHEETDQELDDQAEEIEQEFDGQEETNSTPLPPWMTVCSENECHYDVPGIGSCLYTRDWNLFCRCNPRNGKCGRAAFRKPKL